MTKPSTDTSSVKDNWLESHYPTLEHSIVDRCEFSGVDVVQFFQGFLADSAPYDHFKEFQRERGDKNICYGAWQDNDICSDADFHAINPSMHPNAHQHAKDVTTQPEYEKYLTRTISFQSKTNNPLFGPPFASTTKEQRLLIVNKELAVFESKTTLADIPFSDCFFVMERWIITAEDEQRQQHQIHNNNNSGSYNCIISARTQIFFTKSCLFESQIRPKTIASVSKNLRIWLDMANKARSSSSPREQQPLSCSNTTTTLAAAPIRQRRMIAPETEGTTRSSPASYLDHCSFWIQIIAVAAPKRKKITSSLRHTLIAAMAALWVIVVQGAYHSANDE